MKIFKELLPYIIILIVVILIRTFVITPVRVDGLSMFPTLNDKEVLLLKKYAKNYARFDIVVVDYENNRLVKRVIGLPGESIYYRNNHLFINGKKINIEGYQFDTADFELSEFGYGKIPKNHYFVMGDNRDSSKDSRIIGTFAKEELIGISDFRIWPLNDFGKIK
ncbi:MAG: signal peptidase I [Bacilli bacterium]